MTLQQSGSLCLTASRDNCTRKYKPGIYGHLIRISQLAAQEKQRLINCWSQYMHTYISSVDVSMKCDLPRENRPSSHLVMIVEIPVLKFLISVTSFCSC